MALRYQYITPLIDFQKPSLDCCGSRYRNTRIIVVLIISYIRFMEKKKYLQCDGDYSENQKRVDNLYNIRKLQFVCDFIPNRQVHGAYYTQGICEQWTYWTTWSNFSALDSECNENMLWFLLRCGIFFFISQKLLRSL